MNILTFDIEEWFHILDNEKTKNISNWSDFDSRIHYGMDIIYDILKKQKVSYFFCCWLDCRKIP